MTQPRKVLLQLLPGLVAIAIGGALLVAFPERVALKTDGISHGLVNDTLQITAIADTSGAEMGWHSFLTAKVEEYCKRFVDTNYACTDVDRALLATRLPGPQVSGDAVAVIENSAWRSVATSLLAAGVFFLLERSRSLRRSKVQ